MYNDDEADFFYHGDFTKLEKYLDISAKRISDYFYRRRTPGLETAKRLSLAVAIVLNKVVPWQELLNNRHSTHPAFKGVAVKWISNTDLDIEED